MAVTLDLGDAKDIHPKNKQDVGKRLALVALDQVYKIPTDYFGPLYKTFKIAGNRVEIFFDHSKGITSQRTGLAGFQIAGSDKIFHWAKAQVTNGKVIVWSDQVAKPVSVRYAWGDNPAANLTNRSGLPASPFRTDQW